ncbi:MULTISPECIES: hypothetical protein [Burkholderia]|uniref:hypothetical protein n=1 Tax=Burkholderia TaxID=32008 RepID=UPI00119BEE6B|nr:MULTISPECIES: hypothetical protein [Burkholderia]TWC56178.1 hypothetical protein FB600_1562 [Burkholderia sp. SJZ089]TWC91880.1 hypothetical protein FBX98_1571 [Burkholderia sp. SJZ115]TWC94763.1 hypothetical protein FB601_1591 [Burkholderia sp. SJZ091]
MKHDLGPNVHDTAGAVTPASRFPETEFGATVIRSALRTGATLPMVIEPAIPVTDPLA